MPLQSRLRTIRLRDAAKVGVAILTGASALAPPAHAQEVVAAAKPMTPAEQAAYSRPIPADVCRGMFIVLTDHLEKHGKNAISPDTRRSFRAFFINSSGEITCTGERHIAWRDENDWGTIKAVTGMISGARKIDVAKDYGVWPADRPVGTGQRSEAPAPRVGG